MQNKYVWKKPIFGIIFIIGLIYLIAVFNANGWAIVKQYKEIHCPENTPLMCEIPPEYTDLRETIYLSPGEKWTNHNVDINATKAFNRTILTMLAAGLIINHLFFNRKYKLLKKLKDWIEKTDV